MTGKPDRRIVELREYAPTFFDRQEISERDGELLWKYYSTKVNVEFPTPKTDRQWRLTSQGWVGFIPLTSELVIVLTPKTELGNLFRMLEYAYQLKDVIIFKDLIDCASLQDFYERLAAILAKKTLERGRKGFYRSYVGETDRLPYIRGRQDLQHAIRNPWESRIKCDFEEFTADIEENQIVAWTLSRIARSGICSGAIQPVVREAYRTLQGCAGAVPFPPSSCVNRAYNRLNSDYQTLHGLCRFFLEQAGPGHQVGNHKMLPFLVDMSYLFELFVAEWLIKNLPPGYILKKQERVKVGEKKKIVFKVDLILYDAATREAKYVIDTKYKTQPSPDPADIAQVVTYAETKSCKNAVLLYPELMDEPVDAFIGDKRIRSLTFRLDGDLEEAGGLFLSNLFETTKPNPLAFL